MTTPTPAEHMSSTPARSPRQAPPDRARRRPPAAARPPWWPPAILALVCLGVYAVAVWHTAILPGVLAILGLARFAERASRRWHQAHPDRLRAGWLAILVSVCALIALAASLAHHARGCLS